MHGTQIPRSAAHTHNSIWKIAHCYVFLALQIVERANSTAACLSIWYYLARMDKLMVDYMSLSQSSLERQSFIQNHWVAWLAWECLFDWARYGLRPKLWFVFCIYVYLVPAIHSDLHIHSMHFAMWQLRTLFFFILGRLRRRSLIWHGINYTN